MPNFIQWKGTDVCIDIVCPQCGNDYHFDGDFMYFVRCACGQVFEMGTEVTMTPVVNYPDEAVKDLMDCS